MGILQVALFGGVHVTHNNWLTEAKLTREIQALLAYLLLQRHRAHSREVLAGVFWAEHSQERARRALNTALWRLKKALEPEGIPAGTYLISAHSGEVGFNRESEYWLDLEVFEKETNHLITYPLQTAHEQNVQELEETLNLYRGELLEGLYDDWALGDRERLRALFLKSLMYLMQYYKVHGVYEKASVYGQQILNLDPIREDIHREMMRLYLGSGQRALAARQYESCRSTLVKELGVLPMEETQTLYEQMFPEVHRDQRVLVSGQQPSFDETLGQLHQVSQTIDLVREQVQQTIQSFTKYARPEDEKFSGHISNMKRAGKTRNEKIVRHSE
jgi:DNA-binding SARP family transcriptional activator